MTRTPGLHLGFEVIKFNITEAVKRLSSTISVLWGAGHTNEPVASQGHPCPSLWQVHNTVHSAWLPVWRNCELTWALGQDFQMQLALPLHFNGLYVTLLNMKDDFFKGEHWPPLGVESICNINLFWYPVSPLGEERSELLKPSETAWDLSFHTGLTIRNELTNLDLKPHNLGCWVLPLCHCPLVIKWHAKCLLKWVCCI